MSRSCFWSAGKPVSRISFYFKTHCYASLLYQYPIALVNCNLKKLSSLNALLLKMAQSLIKFLQLRPCCLMKVLRFLL